MAGVEPGGARGSDGPSVRLVGGLAVRRGGELLAGTALGSRKARTLLALLAVERGRRIGADRIAAVLWDGSPPRRPAENVATLVSRLRSVLGPGFVQGDGGGYRLDGPLVEIDLDRAAAQLAEARRRASDAEPALAAAAAQCALTLLGTGEILPGAPDQDWVRAARSEGALLLRQARIAAAEARLDLGDPAAARDAAAAAVAADRYDEAAHRLLMRAEAAAGATGAALLVYQRLRELLAAELGTDPSTQTRAVYQDVLNERETTVRQQRPAIRETVSAAERAGDDGLVGREQELARLDAAWSAAAGGAPALVLVVGEAGVGKTRLATAFAAAAERSGGTVLSARCYETERSLFLQPLVEALGRHAARAAPDAVRAAAGDWVEVLAGLVPEIAEVTGLAAAPPGEQRAAPEVQRRRDHEAVARYLRRTAAVPVLLFLDDLHNAGLATLESLHFLLRRAGSARLLVLATVRAEERGAVDRALAGVAEAVTEIPLGPLPDRAVALLARRAGHADLAVSVLRRTGGHALFVVETLRALSAGETGVPVSLQAAILARVRRAGPEVELLLRAASVLGAGVEPWQLAGMLDIALPEATRRCEAALAARLLVVADRTYEFANDLVREVLYGSMPVPTRIAWHRWAADLLSARPEAVAGHAAAAGDWPRAARAWLEAGEQARLGRAPADAELLFGRALAAAERAGEPAVTGSALLARGRVRDTLTVYQGALEDLRAAVALARGGGDRRLEMLALRELAGDVPVALGLSVTDCAEPLRAGLAIARELGDRVMEADVLARLAVMAVNRLLFTEALEYGRRAVHAARGCSDERALAGALDGLKTGYAYLGETAVLTVLLAELEPLLRRHQDLWRLQWAVQESSFAALAAGDWDLALERIGSALEINRRSGYTAYESWFIGHLGEVHRLSGDLDLALRLGRRAHALTRGSAHAWWRAAACVQLASTLLAVGERDEALVLLEEGRGCADRSGAEAHLLRCLAVLAEVTGERATLERAQTLLDGITAPEGCAWLRGADAYLAVGRAWLERGDPARARAAVAPLLVAAGRAGWPLVRRQAAALVERAGG